MGQKNRVTLKTFFETDDTPTQAEYIDLIDSLLNLIDDQGASGFALFNKSGGNISFLLGNGGHFGLGTASPSAKIHITETGLVPYGNIGDSNTITGAKSFGIGTNLTLSGIQSFGFGDLISISSDNCVGLGKDVTIPVSEDNAFVWNDGVANATSKGQQTFFIKSSKGIFLEGTPAANFSPLNLIGLPTSPTGLNTGDVWIDTTAANTLKIV